MSFSKKNKYLNLNTCLFLCRVNQNLRIYQCFCLLTTICATQAVGNFDAIRCGMAELLLWCFYCSYLWAFDWIIIFEFNSNRCMSLQCMCAGLCGRWIRTKCHFIYTTVCLWWWLFSSSELLEAQVRVQTYFISNGNIPYLKLCVYTCCRRYWYCLTITYCVCQQCCLSSTGGLHS